MGNDIMCVENVPLDTTLNTFIRLYANLTATKFMCREGSCGCCIVALHGLHPVTRQLASWSVNSCLFPIYSCHGMHIVTAEGLKGAARRPHALQARLAASFGSQCGFCSPGFVMTMYGLLEGKNRRVSMSDIENALAGNICRCTGYRPILDAFKSFAMDAPRALADIEDLPKSCTIPRKVCFETVHNEVHLRLPDGAEWHKVYTIPDILRILQTIEDRSYILLSGNTARGLYPQDNGQYPDVFVDVSAVKELRTISLNSVLEIGANVPLSEVIDTLKKASEVRSDFFYCRQMAKHFERIANVAVRNVGTIAGNLSIKYRHKEFVSDIFVLLEAIGATVTIISSIGSIKIMRVADFLKISMKNRIIVRITLPSLPKNAYQYFSYKVMPRAQNSLALLNCAFLFKFNSDRSSVLNARLCFGGINPHFIHATSTEKLLQGRDLFQDCTIQAACVNLESELILDWVLPDPHPNYRKMVALGLFYKAVIGMCPLDRVRPEIRSAGKDAELMLSSGEQHFTAKESQGPVLKLEAMDQCTGDAKYINDMPYMPNEVWGAFVCATESTATIVNVNTSKALDMPGVVAFYGANDIPGINNCTHPIMYQEESQELFCSGRIIYHGQPIGMILAATMDIAQAAAHQVVVTYRRDLTNPPIATIKDALEETNQTRIGRDILNMLDASNHGLDIAYTFTGRFELGSQFHFSLEPQTTICVPSEDGMEVYCSTQWMNLVKVIIAQVVNIPENTVSMQLKRVGGAYGGKLYNSVFAAVACALACHLQRRPVRFVLSLEASMIALGKRLPVLTDYEAKVSELGKIQRLRQEIWMDFGAIISNRLDLHTTNGLQSCYDSSYWTVHGKCVKTNTPSNTWCRGPGFVEGIAMIENIMEHIAKTVKRDSLDVRLENLPEETPMRKYLIDFAKSVCYRKRKMEIDSFNHMNRWRKQGIAIIPISFTTQYYALSSSSVSINAYDGTVTIITSGNELGQGLNTKIAQIAAQTLNIPLSFIKVGPTNDLISNGGTGSVGSQTNQAVGFATQRACKLILERMEPVKREMGDVPWRELTQECFKRFISMSETHSHRPDEDPISPVWAMACAQVEVDILTGVVQVQRVDIAEDVGKSINPHIDIGQIEGAFVMGLGYWLHERILHDRLSGVLTTRNALTYNPPGAKDIPTDFRVTLLDSRDGYLGGVLGSKAVGEPATCLSAVLPCAIRYALDSARRDAGVNDDWYELNCPLTPDRILQVCETKIQQFQL
ncbi:xanthine dehydrogenase-like [Phlebotomus argentipes]|uniref:xanthine dehydrogenase-like n=1 Tax=Phlebotomus argentipes TaxID=94469 RepID=UPI0028935D0A|nr:xanthine dehydrogenase-like [Phlebotomus argentipes]